VKNAETSHNSSIKTLNLQIKDVSKMTEDKIISKMDCSTDTITSMNSTKLNGVKIPLRSSSK
jgi:hypothetical protein